MMRIYIPDQEGGMDFASFLFSFLSSRLARLDADGRLPMSEIVTTSVGRFRRVNTGQPEHDAWLWECPCGQWAYLDEDQWAGHVSVDHAADGCPKNYHETHNFGAE